MCPCALSCARGAGACRLPHAHALCCTSTSGMLLCLGVRTLAHVDVCSMHAGLCNVPCCMSTESTDALLCLGACTLVHVDARKCMGKKHDDAVGVRQQGTAHTGCARIDMHRAMAPWHRSVLMLGGLWQQEMAHTGSSCAMCANDHATRCCMAPRNSQWRLVSPCKFCCLRSPASQLPS